MTDHDDWHIGDDGEIYQPTRPDGDFKVKRGAVPNYRTAQFTEQLTSIIAAYKKIQSSSKYEDLSDIRSIDIYALLTRARAAIERISGVKSVYSHHAKVVLSRGEWNGNKLMALVGIVESLQTDL